jgi:hypothetical protein
MADDYPTPRSKSQIIGEQVAAFLSRCGLKGLRVGSPTLSLIEAAAQSDLRSSADNFQILESISLDDAEGDALDNIGNSEDTPRIQEGRASTYVTVTDTSFTKVETKIYQGTSAPIAGSTSINVASAADLGIGDDIYIGRGTSLYEGPLTISNITAFANYATLDLSSGTTKFHNLGETVIKAQGGDRVAQAGTVVKTPRSALADSIQFKLNYSVTIADGETTLAGVSVVASKPGVYGNVSAQSITEFGSSPFNNATVSNPLPVTNGIPRENDDDYRERIRSIRASRAKGTKLAIKLAALGVTATDEAKRVLSATIISRPNRASVLYIDDGTGYEEISQGTSLEPVVDSAIGGEDTFRTAYRPVTKAYLETQNSAPFALVTGSKLSVDIGGTATDHTFDSDEFRNIASATAYEIVASINGNPDLDWAARTSNNGTKVVIYAKDDENEDIQIQTPSGINANDILVFPSNRAYSLMLYENDQLLSKDGKLATLSSKTFAEWGTLSGTETLILAVDGTSSQTVSVTGQDFIDGATGYVSVGLNSLQAWATVLTNKIAGATVEISGSKLAVTSNKGRSSRAAINITGGTLTTKNVFTIASALGANSDYILDRNTGEIITQSALDVLDRLSIGTSATRAFLESSALSVLTLASTSKLWFSVDGNASIIPTGITSSTSITVATTLHKNGYRAKITATGCFVNVRAGDWVIVWDSAFGTNGLNGRYRVAAVDATGNWIEVEVPQLFAARMGHKSANISSTVSLVTGGYTGVGSAKVASNSAEKFDSTANTVTLVAAMTNARAHHSAVALSGGDIYVLGGISSSGVAIGQGERFNGTSWVNSTTLPASATIARHTATLLADGNVFIVGGVNAAGTYLNTTYIYNTTTNTYTSGPTLTTARANHVAVKMNNGKVLVAGGETTAGAQLSSAELYDPGAGTFAAAGSMSVARHGSVGVLLASGDVLVAGGITTAFNTGYTGTVSGATDQYNGAAWTTKTSMTNGRGYATGHVVSGNSNKVTVLFGRHGGTKMGETFDTGGNTWADVSAPGAALSAQNGSNSHVFLTGFTSGAVVWTIGGADGSTATLKPNASIIKYTANTDAWTVPNPLDQTAITLPNTGFTVVRSTDQTKLISIASGTYTASTLVAQLSGLTGTTASTYKTSRLRVNTNTFDTTGGIALITADTTGQNLTLPVSTVSNLTGHTASTESVNSYVGTPNFKHFVLRDNISSTSLGLQGDASVTYHPKYSYVAAKPLDESATTTNAGLIGDTAVLRSVTSESAHDKLKLTLASAFESTGRPYDRVWLASPYALTAEDTLSVLIDGDSSKKYSFNTWRKLKPNDTPYGSTNTYVDADNGNSSLISTLGSAYGYANHALFMRARTQSHLQGDATHFTTPPADQTKAVLWRYYKFGPSGNNAYCYYDYPTQANQAVAVTADVDQYVGIGIKLASGASRTAPTITNSHKIGYIWKAGTVASVFYGLKTSSVTRAAGTVTVTVDPTFLTNTGATAIAAVNALIGQTMFFKNNNVGYPDGAYAITANTGTTISYVEGAGAAGPTSITGSASYGPSAATLLGSGLAVGDYINFGSGTSLPSQFTSKTIYVSSYNDDLAYQGFVADGSGATTTITWVAISNTSSITYFQAGNKTAAQIVAAVNALTPSMITGTLIGDGTGIITLSSRAEGGTGFTFTDGVNYIDTATTSGGQMQFTTKMTTTASLATNSDWSNEEVRLVPTTAANVVDYLNSLAISGLSSSATIQLTSKAQKVQIASKTSGSTGSVQIQSGTANSTSASLVGTSSVSASSLLTINVNTANAAGFVGGAWVNIDNTNVMPRNIVTSSTALTSITSAGVFTLSGTPVWTNAGASSPTLNNVLQIESQGDFVCCIDTGLGTALSASGVSEGDWVRLKTPATPTGGLTQLSSANAGIFRVIRVDSTNKCFWIENDSTVVQSNAECDIQFLANDSMQVGDTIKISGNVWGASNDGVWTVTSVGDAGSGQYTSQYTFTVDISAQATTATGSVAALGTNSSYVTVNEGTPSRFIKEILYVSPDLTSNTLTKVTLATSKGSGAISSAAGSVMTVRDKLAFPYTVCVGIDGYKHSVGLIGELNKIIEGSPDDPATYPGFKSEGSRINIQGAPIRRLQFSLLIRGNNTTITQNKIRSAVASVVNSKKVGESFAFSVIIAAVERVQGVVSATIISPVYDSSHDLVSIQPYERPFILDLENDISISFLNNT